MSDSGQSPARDPRTATFISSYGSPAARANAPVPAINATTYRSCAGDDNDTGLSISRSKQSYFSITNNFNFANAKATERFFHARTQFLAARACQTDFNCHHVGSSHSGSGASSIESFANSSRGHCYAD